jgi:hypothetical protein
LVIAITRGLMPFASLRVDVGTCIEQKTRGLEPAFPRRERQCRHATGCRRLFSLGRHPTAHDAHTVRSAARARRPDGWLRARAGFHVDCCATRQQQRYERRTILSHRPHQGGVPHLWFGRIDLCTGIE